MKELFILLTLFILIPLPFVFLGWIVWKIVKGFKSQAVGMRNTILQGVPATARIVRVTGGNVNPGDSGGSHTRRFVEYEFEVPGKGTFRGETSDIRLKVGEEIEIFYNPEDPTQSAPKSLVEEGRKNAPAEIPDSDSNP